jgi:hypothetical protein
VNDVLQLVNSVYFRSSDLVYSLSGVTHRVFPGIEHLCRATLLLFRMHHRSCILHSIYVSSDASMKYAHRLAGESHVSTQVGAVTEAFISSLKQTLSMSVLWVLQMEASIQRNVSSYGQS